MENQISTANLINNFKSYVLKTNKALTSDQLDLMVGLMRNQSGVTDSQVIEALENLMLYNCFATNKMLFVV